MTYPVERLRNALSDVIEGYTVRYDRWSDADMQSEERFVVFRLAGTGGDSAFDLQQPDIRVILVGRPTDALALRETAWAIMQHFRDAENVSDDDVVVFAPIGFPQGPMEMSDGRLVWELTIRVSVTDY